MRPIATRTAAAVSLTIVLAATAACGGSGGTPDAQASPAKVETPSAWPPKGSSGDTAVYPYLYGVSWRAPRGWKFERADYSGNDGFLWRTGKKKGGSLLNVSIQNSRSTVDDWLKIAGNISGVRKTLDEKVSVPGYGPGRHLRFLNPKNGATQDMLVVTSVDGVLLQMDVYLPQGADTGLADELVASVKRGSA